MATPYIVDIQIKTGTTLKIKNYIGKIGELVLDSDTKELYVSDGATQGLIPAWKNAANIFLSGLVTNNANDILASDSILEALGKLQAQSTAAGVASDEFIKRDGSVDLNSYIPDRDNSVTSKKYVDIQDDLKVDKALLATTQGPGVATLIDGKVLESQLPDTAFNNVYKVSSQAEMLALHTGAAKAFGGIQRGDIVVINEPSKSQGQTYVAQKSAATTGSDWVELEAKYNQVDWDLTSGVGYIKNKPLIITDDSGGLTDVLSAEYGKFLKQEVDKKAAAFVDLTDGPGVLGTPKQIITVQGTGAQAKLIFEDLVVSPKDINLDSYVMPSTPGHVGPSDDIQQAIGKLEKGIADAKAGGGDINVQSDWNEVDLGSDAYIKNKPQFKANFLGLTDTPVVYEAGAILAVNQAADAVVQVTSLDAGVL